MSKTLILDIAGLICLWDLQVEMSRRPQDIWVLKWQKPGMGRETWEISAHGWHSKTYISYKHLCGIYSTQTSLELFKQLHRKLFKFIFYIKFKWRPLFCEKVRIYSWSSIFIESVFASLPTCENVFGTLKSILAFTVNHRLVETVTHSTHIFPAELSSCFCFHTIKNCPLRGLLPVTCFLLFLCFSFFWWFLLKMYPSKALKCFLVFLSAKRLWCDLQRKHMR